MLLEQAVEHFLRSRVLAQGGKQLVSRCYHLHLHAGTFVTRRAELAHMYLGRLGEERDLIDTVVGTIGIVAIVVYLHEVVLHGAIEIVAHFGRNGGVAIHLIPLTFGEGTNLFHNITRHKRYHWYTLTIILNTNTETQLWLRGTISDISHIGSIVQTGIGTQGSIEL